MLLLKEEYVTMTNEEKNQLSEALRRHAEEQLGKRGWSKTAIAAVVAVIGAVFAFWCSSCAEIPEMKLDVPQYGNIHIISQPSVK